MTKLATALVSTRAASVCALLAAFGIGIVGCSGNRNHDQRERQADRDAEEADALGLIDFIPCGEDLSLRCCVGDCRPDPGSAPVNCDKREEGLEFMSPAIWDFEGVPAMNGHALVGGTAGMYMYTDRSITTSSGSMALQVPGAFLEPAGYQPPGELTERCGKPTTAFHLRGGIFRNFGAGIGRSLSTYPGDQPERLQTAKSGIDASAWDGISLWARRGPNGQAQLRVGVGDAHTDDDLNRAQNDPNDMLEAPRADGNLCRRVRPCDCPSGTPCTRSPTYRVSYCYDPAVDPEPEARDDYYVKCGDSRCDDVENDGDNSFAGKACTPFLTESGEERSFCFDEGLDPDPAEGHEQCGDHWMSGIHLTPDWQLFLIPFTSLQQQGYGKNSPRLHTDALSMLRMTWESGWIDFWIDDVRFYRIKR